MKKMKDFNIVLHAMAQKKEICSMVCTTLFYPYSVGEESIYVTLYEGLKNENFFEDIIKECLDISMDELYSKDPLLIGIIWLAGLFTNLLPEVLLTPINIHLTEYNRSIDYLKKRFGKDFDLLTKYGEFNILNFNANKKDANIILNVLPETMTKATSKAYLNFYFDLETQTLPLDNLFLEADKDDCTDFWICPFFLKRNDEDFEGIWWVFDDAFMYVLESSEVDNIPEVENELELLNWIFDYGTFKSYDLSNRVIYKGKMLYLKYPFHFFANANEENYDDICVYNEECIDK